MLKNIENHLTSLEEVEISSSHEFLVTDNNDITKINNAIINHFKEYSPRFNLTFRLICTLNYNNEELDFYTEFEEFKMTESKRNYRQFSKTFRILPKVTTTVILNGK